MKTIVLLGITVFLPSASGAEILAAPRLEEVPPTIVWERHFGEDEINHSHKEMRVTSNNEILITTVSRTSSSQPDSTWVWEINQSGQKLSQIEIKKGYIDIVSVAANEDNHRMVVLDSFDNQPSLSPITKSDEVQKSKKIIMTDKKVNIFKILPSLHNNFILIGSDRDDALAMKIDHQGKMLWRKTFDKGMQDFFTDGVETKDGGCLLIANSGNYEIPGIGPSHIWVVKLDADGEIEKEKTLPGRYGSVAQSTEGGYAVAYDKGDLGIQDIWLDSFNDALHLIWSAPITEVKPGFHVVNTFKVAATADSNFVVVGGNSDGKLYMTKISAAGVRIWTFVGNEMLRSISYDVKPLEADFLAASSFFIQSTDSSGNRTATENIRLIRFTDGQ